jgi:hypothetical protein
MEEKDYKQEIRDTRIGCLGSSDARLLQQIALLGYVPKTAHERMAVLNGLISPTDIPRTPAVEYGDIIEMEIYRHLTQEAGEGTYQSNPLWESKKYSRSRVRLISHPDIVRFDNDTRTLYIYEVKTTRHSVADTRDTYRPQIFIHSLLGNEITTPMKGRWRVRTFLVHYSTAGLNLSDGIYPEFDPSRITIREVKFKRTSPLFNVAKAMDVTDRFLMDFTEYLPGEEVDADMLPTPVRTEFDHIASVLAEIKQREDEVATFKKKLFNFLSEKGIKSIRSDAFTISRVDDTTTTTFDTKKFLEDYANEHPRLAAALHKRYDKTTIRKGYATIKIKNN